MSKKRIFLQKLLIKVGIIVAFIVILCCIDFYQRKRNAERVFTYELNQPYVRDVSDLTQEEIEALMEGSKDGE